MVFKTYEKRYRRFRLKELPQKTLLIPELVTNLVSYNSRSNRAVVFEISLALRARPILKILGNKLLRTTFFPSTLRCLPVFRV